MSLLSKEERQLFFECVENLNSKTEFLKLKDYRHHFHTSTYNHSIGVAYLSYGVSKRLKLKCDDKTLIYGALLHDYYLYNCHQDKRTWHLFRHPTVSLMNAKRDWSINQIQANMIQTHMFPLTIKPPKYKESVIVNFADKACALYECLLKKPYMGKKALLL